MSPHELIEVSRMISSRFVGESDSLRTHITNILKSTSSFDKEILKKAIFDVYDSRTLSQENVLMSQQNHFIVQSSNFDNHKKSYVNYSPIYVPHDITDSILKHSPFYHLIHTLLEPAYWDTSKDFIHFTGVFFLDNDLINSFKQQLNNMQIIVQFMNTEFIDYVNDCLPAHLSILVNNLNCKLPLSHNLDGPCHCNVSLNITDKVNLTANLPNTIKMSWMLQPLKVFAVGVFVATKLSSYNLLKTLKKKPLRCSEKTMKLLYDVMANVNNMSAMDSINVSILDPFNKKRIKTPVRSVTCSHVQCFDALQFLKINEIKETWICPICKKEAMFEDIEIDEFFLTVLNSSNLSEDCKSINFHNNGTWTENV